MIRILILAIVSGNFLWAQTEYITGQSYFGTRDFIEFIPGNLPIIISAPHGGLLLPEDLPDISEHVGDRGTDVVTRMAREKIMELTDGGSPWVIINHVKSRKLLCSNNIDKAAGEHEDARAAWNEFHEFIEYSKEQVIQKWGAGHYFDMHSNAHDAEANEVGMRISFSTLSGGDSAILDNINTSSIRSLLTGKEDAEILEIVKGSTSMGGLLQTRGFKSIPSHEIPVPPSSNFFYTGWNSGRHGSKDSGTIDATQLENYFSFVRFDQENFSTALSEALVFFMETHYHFDLSEWDLPAKSVPQNIESFSSPLKIRIYNLQGDLIQSYGKAPSDFKWDGMDQKGIRLAPGIYFQQVGNKRFKLVIHQ